MDILTFNQKTNSLIEKYSPITIKDIIGSKRQVYALKEWIKKYNKNAKINLQKQSNKKPGKKTRKQKSHEKTASVLDKSKYIDQVDNSSDDECNIKKTTKKRDPDICSCAIITGDHGAGKTAVVKAVLNGMGFLIKSINFAKLGYIKSVEDFIENLLIGVDIYEAIDNVSHKKFAVLIDDIQSISTPIEKDIINSLLKINSELWKCPVIFVGSNKHKKIITCIKKECYHIIMYPPEADDLLQLLERIGLGEEMRMENEDIVTKIIQHSQNDYRRLIVTMGELYRLHGSNTIKTTDLVNYINFTGKKEMDRSIYENTVILFAQYDGINAALKIFESDKSNMPLMVQQNHFLATIKYLYDKSKLIDISADLTGNIARGDIVDNYIHSDQNWTLQETYGFYSCVYPSFKLNGCINTNKLAHDAKYPYYRPVFSSLYPKDLNRTSTRCINYKNIKSANEYFQNMNIDDYILAAKIVKHTLEDKNINECEKLIKDYKLTAQSIMYVLKIDKINGTKKDVPKYIEKRVKEIAFTPIKLPVKKN